MLRGFDVLLIGVMTAAAVVTYTIKHKAELKLEEVRRIEAEIKLERDTIELLKADWALLTQPNRLERLVNVYAEDLKLVSTHPTQLAMPAEMPMMRAQLPQPEGGISEEGNSDAIAGIIQRERIESIPAARKPAGASTAVTHIPVPVPRGRSAIDAISTGSVKR